MRAVIVVVAGLAMSSAAAADFRTMQMDMNDLPFQAKDAVGVPSPFGGLTHTGALSFGFGGSSILGSILMKTDPGPFIPDPNYTGSLTDFFFDINLSNGNVTGGTIGVTLNTGDTYMASVDAAGQVATFVGGGFIIEGLTSSGAFSGPSFGGVAIADFFANQGGDFLKGFYISFKIQPGPGGSGFGDVDLFVTNIPAPASLALIGLGGLLAARRRR